MIENKTRDKWDNQGQQNCKSYFKADNNLKISNQK